MKKIIIALAIIILGWLGYLYITHKNVVSAPAVSTADTILFVGNGCPHCKIVEDYMAANNVTDKIKMDQLEIFDNSANAQLMTEKAAACGIDKNNFGVPLLWVSGKCYSGDEEVIQYFKDQMNGK